MILLYGYWGDESGFAFGGLGLDEDHISPIFPLTLPKYFKYFGFINGFLRYENLRLGSKITSFKVLYKTL